MNIDIPQSLETQNAAAINAFIKHDWPGFEKTYEKDAVVMLLNGQKLQGRKAIKRYFSDLEGVESLEYKVIAGETSGELSYEILALNYWLEPEHHPVAVEVLQVLKQQASGKWQVQAAFYSSPDAQAAVH